MASEAGKGPGRRPGKGFQEGHERIYGKRERTRYIPPPPGIPASTPEPAPKDKTP